MRKMQSITTLTLLLFTTSLNAENLYVNVTVTPQVSVGKPIKLMQTDIPYKEKSKIRRLYEKGDKDFRVYYENKWYTPHAHKMITYNDRFMAKFRAKNEAYKVLRREDYIRYGCEEEAKYHKYKYSVDYFTSLTSQYHTITTTEECEKFLKVR